MRRSWPTARIREIRREWIQRLLDHDGAPGEDGGIEAWLRLGRGRGPGPGSSCARRSWCCPGVRFAVDAYVNFARRASWQEAASSSLTELFAPQIHQSRLDTWPQHYPWIDRDRLRVLPQPSGPGPAAMWSMAWHHPRSTTRTGGRASNACWRFCSSSSIFCGHARRHEHGLRAEPPAVPQRTSERVVAQGRSPYEVSTVVEDAATWRPGYRFQYRTGAKGPCAALPRRHDQAQRQRGADRWPDRRPARCGRDHRRPEAPIPRRA